MRSSLFGADHVADPMAHIRQGELRDAELTTVGAKVLDLDSRHRIGRLGGHIPAGGPGRNIVIHRGQHGPGSPDAVPRKAQALEGLRTGDLVDQMSIDIDQTLPARPLLDQMGGPEFHEKGGRRHRAQSTLMPALRMTVDQ